MRLISVGLVLTVNSAHLPLRKCGPHSMPLYDHTIQELQELTLETHMPRFDNLADRFVGADEVDPV